MMCGIIGLYQLGGAPADAHAVLRAAHTMRHRGPDDEGYLLVSTTTGAVSLRRGPDSAANIDHAPLDAPTDFTPDLVLGHRRLAILDLSPAGHEPMTAHGSQSWLTYNGEVYNYVELRDELRALGYAFHTECDAEVIIQAYEAWGVECVQRFVGMFSFALYDARRRRLWCVRDRFGVKPFYYTSAGDHFAFASEIKALRDLFPRAARPNMPRLLHYIETGRVHFAPDTFFEGVCELPGAHYLLIEDGQVREPVRYWDVDLDRARATYNYDDIEGEFLRLMDEAVRLRLRSDVPVGTCLSGGLDSSTIVALATKQLDGGRMNSFSAVYPVKGYDEKRYIDLVAGRYNTIPHATTPTPDDYFAHTARITWHQDIPTGSPTVYSQYFVMQLAHGVVTVLLDGQGADELFGGYLSYVVYHLNALRRRDFARWLRESAHFALEVQGRFNSALNLRQFVNRVQDPFRHQRRTVLSATYLIETGYNRHQFAQRQARLEGADPLNDLLYRAVTRDSIPALLHYEDRNSMAHSIEARVPFLDHRLAEFALGVHGDHKIRGAETKVFMRRALRGVLPTEITNRRDKLGYPTPFSTWLRGDLAREAGTFLSERVMRREWIDAADVAWAWQGHQAGRADYGALLHRLISAEQWLEACVTR